MLKYKDEVIAALQLQLGQENSSPMVPNSSLSKSSKFLFLILQQINSFFSYNFQIQLLTLTLVSTDQLLDLKPKLKKEPEILKMKVLQFLSSKQHHRKHKKQLNPKNLLPQIKLDLYKNKPMHKLPESSSSSILKLSSLKKRLKNQKVKSRTWKQIQQIKLLNFKQYIFYYNKIRNRNFINHFN